MRARKRFGQHFLRDDKVLRALTEMVCPQPGETIVEIGPGDGAWTEHLLNAGAKVAAVEIDRDLAAHLRQKFSTPNFNLIQGDVLQTDLSELLPEQTRVAGNLPYNISTPLLFHLLRYRPCEMWLMLQTEVAERICAMPGGPEYGRLTISVALQYEALVKLSVPPEAFDPPPKVESTVIQLRRKKNSLEHTKMLPSILSAAFQSRRKMLGNGLSSFTVDWQGANISPASRPQTLSPEEFARLSFFVQSKDPAANVNS